MVDLLNDKQVYRYVRKPPYSLQSKFILLIQVS